MPALSSTGRFLVRLLAAYVVSVLAVGALQHRHAADQARHHARQDAAERLDADVRFLERAFLHS